MQTLFTAMPGPVRGEAKIPAVIESFYQTGAQAGSSSSTVRVQSAMLARCDWAKSELMTRYHDEEWGVPIHDDRALFEFLCLEGAQAGLSWETVLKKRDNYRAAFENFDPAAVSAFNQRQIERLLGDAGLIRNRLKMASAVATPGRCSNCRRNSAASTLTSGASWTAASSSTPGRP